MHKDFDYTMFFIGYLLLTVFEYNIATHKGAKESTTYENTRIFVLLLMACVYGKHIFIHHHYDYLILGTLYLTYAGLLAGSETFHTRSNELDVIFKND